MASDVVTKGEFAVLRRVTPGRVSQWIAEGKIKGDALVGQGRFAKIRVAVAVDQLRQSLSLGQMLGNGITTDLRPVEAADDDLPFAPTAQVSMAEPLKPGGVDEQLRQARLEQMLRANRQAEREELAERGVYIPTEEARAGMVSVAAAMMAVFEGGLADFASAVAAKFEVPERDVLHLLRSEFRGIRAKAAEAAKRKAQVVDAIIEHDPSEPRPAAA